MGTSSFEQAKTRVFNQTEVFFACGLLVEKNLERKKTKLKLHCVRKNVFFDCLMKLCDLYFSSMMFDFGTAPTLCFSKKFLKLKSAPFACRGLSELSKNATTRKKVLNDFCKNALKRSDCPTHA